MKKFFSLLFMSAIALVVFIDPTGAKPKPRPGSVIITVNKHPKPHIHRSAVPEITAYYDENVSAFEFEFNDCVGHVVIYILNPMLQPIAKYECNTDMESMAFIPCALYDSGIYTIKILGRDLEAEGYIDVDGSL